MQLFNVFGIILVMEDNKIIEEFFCGKLTVEQAKQLNPLVLAFIGDMVFSFYVKTKKIDFMKLKVNSLNGNTAKLVNAKSQHEFLLNILTLLTEEENDIVHRARNTNIHSRAKNFSIEEYRYATAYEALIGYLYLSNKIDRLTYLLEVSMGEEK